MQHADVALEDAQYQTLQRIAREDGVSVSDLVQRVIEEYLEQRRRAALAKLDAAVAELRAHLPTDLTPEEIEAEITAAREEVREERRAARRR
jgi:predicted DNA-binding ribbon-helix-helix protein